VPHKRPRTKAAKKRRLRIKMERRLRKKNIRIPGGAVYTK
jgi:hypothetical protein